MPFAKSLIVLGFARLVQTKRAGSAEMMLPQFPDEKVLETSSQSVRVGASPEAGLATGPEQPQCDPKPETLNPEP